MKTDYFQEGIVAKHFQNHTSWSFSAANSSSGQEETRSGTKKQCSHNLQSGHPAWWSADNCGFFSTVQNIFIEATSEPVEEMIKKHKNIMHLCFSCISYLYFVTEIAGKTKTQAC